ncbi:MAG: PQQ-binding-like beta-propeller repeat protein [Alphaproteobacteria bacterium]
MTKKNILKLSLLLLILNGCSDLKNVIGSKSEPKLEGKRINIIKIESELSSDPDLAGLNVILPNLQNNYEVLNSNFSQNNLPENIKFETQFQSHEHRVFNKFKYSNISLHPPMLIANGVIYVSNNIELRAYSETDLKTPIWVKQIHSTGSNKEQLGGGMVYNDKKIYITAGHREIIAINAENGKEIWRHTLNNISRSSPVVYNDKVYVMTIDNKLYALSTEDGNIFWMHEGAESEIGVFGSPSLAIANNIVIVPHSSGQLHALNSITGEEIWSVNLAFSKSNLEGFALNDIDTTPLIVGRNIYVAANMGSFYSIDLETGQLNWKQEIKEVKTFWYAGEYLFAINQDMELFAIHSKSGKIKWIVRLEDQVIKSKSKSVFYGPIVANDMIFVTSSEGDLLFISPNNGKTLSKKKIAKNFVSLPMIIKNKIYIFSKNSILNIVE